MKIFSTIFYSLFILLLLGVAGLFLVPLLPIDNNIEIKIVESGSMEPAIMTGSLVVVAPQSNYAANDVITFKSASAEIPTTHRIVSIENKEGTLWFTTKGDANEEADNEVTPANSIIGKVLLAVPYVGFVLDFARQPIGFMLLIVLPAFMIVLGEIEKIWKEIRKKKKNDDEDGQQDEGNTDKTVTSAIIENVRLRKSHTQMMDIASPVRYAMLEMPAENMVVQQFTPASVSKQTGRAQQTQEWATSFVIVLVSVCFASLSFIGSTVSYFNDTESSLQNLLRATALDFNVLADGDVYNFLGTDLVDGDGALITIVAPEVGSVDAKYTVAAEKMSGSDLFCGSIVASAGVPALYDGPLLGLSATGVSFSDPWAISLSLTPDVVGLIPNEECVIDIVYTAWNSEGAAGVGYSDIERVQLEFYAPADVAPLAAPSFAPLSSFEEQQPPADETPLEEEEELEPEEVEEPVTEEEEATEVEEPVEDVEETEEAEVEEIEVEETV